MESKRLPRAPLVYVIAKIDFSPIENMESKIREIQDMLRNNGYPNYSAQEISAFSVSPSLCVKKSKRWVFSNKEKSGCIRLTNDSIVFCVSDYDTFLVFVEHISDKLNAIDSITDFHNGTITEIQIRYIDLLTSLDGKSAKDFLCKEFFSSNLLFSEDTRMLQFMTEMNMDDNTMSRVILFSSKSKEFPPQIVPVGLNQVSVTLDESMLILDTTYTREVVDTDYDLNKICENLNDLHLLSSKTFKEKLVTDEALKIWGKKS